MSIPCKKSLNKSLIVISIIDICKIKIVAQKLGKIDFYIEYIIFVFSLASTLFNKCVSIDCCCSFCLMSSFRQHKQNVSTSIKKNVVESVKVTVLFNSISFADFVDTKATGKKTLA